MDIKNNYNQTNFYARNKEIKIADQIMRQAKNTYPAISTSKGYTYSVVKKNPKNIYKCYKKYWELVKLRKQREELAAVDKIKKILSDTQATHNGNCSEMATISQAAFITNGYKDVKLVKLKLNEEITQGNKITSESYEIDHIALIINAGEKADLNNPKTFNKKAIIVDPWVGFVDYIHNGLTKYDGIFMDGFRNENNILGKMKQRIVFKQYDPLTVNNEICESFAISNPELKLKKIN